MKDWPWWLLVLLAFPVACAAVWVHFGPGEFYLTDAGKVALLLVCSVIAFLEWWRK